MTRNTAILAVFLLAAGATPAAADNCAVAASRLAAAYGGQVLSVRAEGSQCIVRLRIPGQGGGPPRVVEESVAGG